MLRITSGQTDRQTHPHTDCSTSQLSRGRTNKHLRSFAGRLCSVSKSFARQVRGKATYGSCQSDDEENHFSRKYGSYDCVVELTGRLLLADNADRFRNVQWRTQEHHCAGAHFEKFGKNVNSKLTNSYLRKGWTGLPVPLLKFFEMRH